MRISRTNSSRSSRLSTSSASGCRRKATRFTPSTSAACSCSRSRMRATFARDTSKSRAKVARIREREQEQAADVLGVKRVAFLRHPDAELVESLELREEFVREIRVSKPDVLLTFDPNVPYRFHPDHRIVGRVALDAAWP